MAVPTIQVNNALASTYVRASAVIGARLLLRTRATMPSRSTRAVLEVTSEAKKVVVVGAGGRTGALVLEKLLSKPDDFVVRGVVRSEKTAQKAKKAAPSAKDDTFFLADITDKAGFEAALKKEASGYDALVLLTSAVPKVVYLSILTALITKILPGVEAKRPDFYFPEGGSPEEVDYKGAVNQIEASKAADIKKVVFVGSMGGTQIDNFLNTMGGSNILLWKRKAEMYLVASGLDYTIIHPGGLKDTDGGKRQLIVNLDDKILDGDKIQRGVPRSDVAEMVVQCIAMDAAKNISFDLASKEETTGIPATTDYTALVASLDGKSCDYSLPKDSPVALP